MLFVIKNIINMKKNILIGTVSVLFLSVATITGAQVSATDTGIRAEAEIDSHSASHADDTVESEDKGNMELRRRTETRVTPKKEDSRIRTINTIEAENENTKKTEDGSINDDSSQNRTRTRTRTRTQGRGGLSDDGITLEEDKKLDTTKEERVENRRVGKEAKREEKKTRKEEERKQRILAYSERMTNRLNSAIARIEKLEERVTSRIQKFEERGIDISISTKLLEEARTQIQVAKNSILSTKAEIIIAIESENPKEAFEKVRETIKMTVEGIKNSHKAVVESIKALKASFENSVTSTTTVETTENEAQQ